MITRQTFLQQASIALAAGAVSPQMLAVAAEPTAGNAMVGSQVYGWGQYYEREGKSLSTHMDEVLSGIRDAGYDYAEGFLSGTPEANLRFGEQLKAKGLKPVALYTSGKLHEAATADANLERLIASAKAAAEAGFTIINCNPEAIGREKTDDELATQAHSLQFLGKELRELGLKLGVHNHTPEMVNGRANFTRTSRRLTL